MMKNYRKPITNGFLCTQCNCFASELFFRGDIVIILVVIMIIMFCCTK